MEALWKGLLVMALCLIGIKPNQRMRDGVDHGLQALKMRQEQAAERMRRMGMTVPGPIPDGPEKEMGQ